MNTIEIEIAGMTCSHCSMAVKRELSKIDNLNEIEVSIGKAVAKAREREGINEEVTSAIKKAGYSVVDIKMQ